ncbi:MAG: hypothetical protein ABR975_02080 [Vulcanimicrobiaceae bacterium]
MNGSSALSLIVTCVFIAVTTPWPAAAQWSGQQTGWDESKIACKFTRIVVHGNAPDSPIELQMDYRVKNGKSVLIDGVGMVPPIGSVHIVTRNPILRVANPETNETIATYNLRDLASGLQTAVSESTGFAPAERLHKDELLYELGDEQRAIPDLAQLASAGTLPNVTRQYAALQLGRAFATHGDTSAAEAQFARVARSNAPAIRNEAIVRASSLQIRNGDQVVAYRAVEQLKGPAGSSSPYATQAKSNQNYLRAVASAPAVFSHTTPLASAQWREEDDEIPTGFQEMAGERTWKDVVSYQVMVQLLWSDVFNEPVSVDNCPSGELCTSTPYLAMSTPLDGRFIRCAFRIRRWFTESSRSTKDVYKVEYSVEERVVGQDQWRPSNDDPVLQKARDLANDFATRVQKLGDWQ